MAKHKGDRHWNYCGPNLPFMQDEDGKRRTFDFKRFAPVRDTYYSHPNPATLQDYFLEVVPVISWEFRYMWNRYSLIEKDFGMDPAEVFVDVCFQCLKSIKPMGPDDDWSWIGSASWKQCTRWSFWTTHNRNEKECKRQQDTVSLDAQLPHQQPRAGNVHRDMTVNIHEDVIQFFLSGQYPWRVSPDFCQFLAVKRLGYNYSHEEVKSKGADSRYYCRYLWKHGTANDNLIDFLHRHVHVRVKMELWKRGALA